MEKVNIQNHLASENLVNEIELLFLLYPYFQNQKSFIITSTGEGFSFSINGLYKFLDKACNHFKFPKNKIYIETWNLLEKHDEYNIIIKNEIFDCYYFKNPSVIEKPIDKKIGIFLGRSDYLRLNFHQKLQNIGWRDKLIYTFHNNLFGNPWPTGMKEIIVKGGNYKFFEKTTPCSDIIDNVRIPIVPPENIFNLAPTYQKIIFEIVFETLYQTGFFITEKTLRPIFYGKPFIAIGPPNFEKNLEKLGFNLNFNFPHFNVYNKHSFEKLNMTFDIIETWLLKTDLDEWYNSIIPILNHNQQVLKKYADNNGYIDLEIINQLS
jgi:hypothetical protein